jgi:hypothetical protein
MGPTGLAVDGPSVVLEMADVEAGSGSEDGVGSVGVTVSSTEVVVVVSSVDDETLSDTTAVVSGDPVEVRMTTVSNVELEIKVGGTEVTDRDGPQRPRLRYLS